MEGSKAERLVERGAPHRFAHGALAHLRQGFFDALHLEQVLERIGLRVLDGGGDFDQIGIRRQHSRIVANAVLLRYIHDDSPLDGPWQMPVIAGTHGLHVLAEPQNDGTLLGVDAVDAAADPHRRRSRISTLLNPRPKFGRTLPAADTAAPAEQRRQAALQIAQHIVQIILRLLRAIPGIAFLAARFVPSHACA